MGCAIAARLPGCFSAESGEARLPAPAPARPLLGHASRAVALFSDLTVFCLVPEIPLKLVSLGESLLL